MGKRIARAAAGPLLLSLLLLPAAAQAQLHGYDVRAVAVAAETMGPSLSDAGDVAYLMGSGAPLDATIYIDSDGVSTPITPPAGYLAGGFPFLNAGGTVSFGAFLNGGDTGLFLGGSSTGTVLMDGDPTPEGGSYGASFGSLNIHANGDSGDIVFFTDVTNASFTGGIFRVSGVTHEAVALQSQTAPGTGGGTYGLLGSPALNDAGSVVFASEVVGGSAASGIFLATPDVLSPTGWTHTALVLAGDTAPGTGGATYTEFAYPQLGASAVVFIANTAGGSAGGGVFRVEGGAHEAIAVEFGAAPETGGGTWHQVTMFPTTNAAGDLVFPATITGGTVAAGVFHYDAATAEMSAVALSGEAAPDTSGATYVSFDYTSLNDGGEVAFNAVLDDGNDGVFLASPPPPVPALSSFGTLVLFLALGVTAALMVPRVLPLAGPPRR